MGSPPLPHCPCHAHSATGPIREVQDFAAVGFRTSTVLLTLRLSQGSRLKPPNSCTADKLCCFKMQIGVLGMDEPCNNVAVPAQVEMEI